MRRSGARVRRRDRSKKQHARRLRLKSSLSEGDRPTALGVGPYICSKTPHDIAVAISPSERGATAVSGRVARQPAPRSTVALRVPA